MTESPGNDKNISPLNVVYVDDDHMDQEIFGDAIAQLENKINLTLLNGCEDLIIHLDKNPGIDLIFLDINLPIMDGKMCLKTLKDHPVYSNIPIVIFTGSNSERDINDVRNLGAHYHMIKPIAQINLIASLKIIFSINWREKQPLPQREKFVINFAYLE